MNKRKVEFVVVSPWSQLNGYGEDYGREVIKTFKTYDAAESFILNLDEEEYEKLEGRPLAIDKIYSSK